MILLKKPLFFTRRRAGQTRLRFQGREKSAEIQIVNTA